MFEPVLIIFTVRRRHHLLPNSLRKATITANFPASSDPSLSFRQAPIARIVQALDSAQRQDRGDNSIQPCCLFSAKIMQKTLYTIPIEQCRHPCESLTTLA